MPRRKRIHYYGAIYHVILRGNYKKIIFFCDQDKKQFCEYMHNVCDVYDCSIHLFCLMSNHLHIMVKVGYVPLSKIMQGLASRYARYINKKQDARGHLYDDRYYASLVHGEKYLLELCYYIHMNPVKSGMVSDIDDYKWSSHRTYLAGIEHSWVTTQYLHKILKKHVTAESQHYLHFIRDKQKDVEHLEIPKFNENERCSLNYTFNSNDSHFVGVEIIDLPIKTIIEVICEHAQISYEQLVSGGSNKRNIIVRSMIAYFAHYRSGYLLVTIAGVLNKGPDAISETMHALLKKTQSDKKLKELLQILEKKLLLVAANQPVSDTGV